MEGLNRAISEKELKLLLDFIKDNLQEAKETTDEESRNKRIDQILEHIQLLRRLSVTVKVLSSYN